MAKNDINRLLTQKPLNNQRVKRRKIQIDKLSRKIKEQRCHYQVLVDKRNECEEIATLLDVFWNKTKHKNQNQIKQNQNQNKLKPKQTKTKLKQNKTKANKKQNKTKANKKQNKTKQNP